MTRVMSLVSASRFRRAARQATFAHDASLILSCRSRRPTGAAWDARAG